MKKRYVSWPDVLDRLNVFDLSMAHQRVYGVPKAGMILAGFLQFSRITNTPQSADVILDDIIASGGTRDAYKKAFPDKPFVALYNKSDGTLPKGEWLVFPWEVDPIGRQPNDTAQGNITRLLEYIGEDYNREGLRDTPNRIVRSYEELYAGYQQDPADLFTTFGIKGCNQIVLLKNCEVYSMCEHHLLPFFGVAHIAYIPGERVIGLSKLARLVDAYARRLQVQERIGEQVTDALMKYLQPKAAACIIKAQHMCMLMRGVGKQNSVVITSSVKGAFLEDARARQELMVLVQAGGDVHH